MRYGAMNFPIVPILDEIETFAGLGFDYLELTMDHPEAHYSTVSANQAAITKALQRHDMGIVCHLPTFVSPADLTDSIRRASVTEMKRSLSVATDMGARKVVLHPPMIGGMGAYVPERAMGYAYDFLAEILSQSETLGVTICLENMMPRNNFGVEPSELETIFNTFPSLKFTLDTGHANLNDNGQNRLQELVRRFVDRVGHVHLSDNRGVYDDHFRLGTGNIDFSNLANALVEAGYDDTVTFEVFDRNRQMLVESREFWCKLVDQ
jgi:sugar phosphate isomerase/epimerase